MYTDNDKDRRMFTFHSILPIDLHIFMKIIYMLVFNKVL